MSKYLSLIFLYNKSCAKNLLLVICAVPVGFLAIFFMQTGGMHGASPYMLVETGFGGMLPILFFIVANMGAMLIVVSSLNSKKALKAAHSTVGFTMRRLRISPLAAYFTTVIYAAGVIVIIWGVSAGSLLLIGKTGLAIAGAENIKTALALGILRTGIGHALLPLADSLISVFNIAAVLALAGEYGRSCYISWHNGRQPTGFIVIALLMFVVWACGLAGSYLFMADLMIVLYTVFFIGDVIAREKRLKGDPFLVNKYIGMLDMDSTEFDETVLLEANSMNSGASGPGTEADAMQRYGRNADGSRKNGIKKLNPFWLRRRYMPLGINMERAGFLFGAGIFTGVLGHFVFYGKFMICLKEIRNGITGITLDQGIRMPYFWDLQHHSYYGYIAAILLVFILQAYWNHGYYNKETKSVYVMKRLPDQKEYRRTIWVAPAAEAFLLAVLMTVHTLIDLFMYIVSTPAIALHPDYLSNILLFWEVIK